jgi:O-antigen/teichoic acid export membrane protein
MSRQALDDRDGLRRSYTRAVRWLITIALPICLATTFLATPLIRLLGGPEFLPAGATALSVMIWFLPFSFANGIAQYVLLATDRQRLVAPSFLVAVVFNITFNLYAIPKYGFVGAAVVTILSELVLLVPFSYGLRDLGAPPLAVTIWRPALAAAAMGLALAGLAALEVNQWLSAVVGGIAYLATLRVVGGFTAEDRALLGRLSGRMRKEPDGHPI